MILTEVTNELAQTTGDPALEALAHGYASRVMDHLLRPQRNAVLEFLTRYYQELPPPAGTFVMPGHAIESMWFVMHLARRRRDSDTIRRAAEAMRRHLERGWDQEYGGLLLGLDLEGNEPYLPHADKKLWWPHTESLYGTLLAHALTGEPPREGSATDEIIALPVKDPFHLPRADTLILQLLDHHPPTGGSDTRKVPAS